MEVRCTCVYLLNMSLVSTPVGVYPQRMTVPIACKTPAELQVSAASFPACEVAGLVYLGLSREV